MRWIRIDRSRIFGKDLIVNSMAAASMILLHHGGWLGTTESGESHDTHTENIRVLRDGSSVLVGDYGAFRRAAGTVPGRALETLRILARWVIFQDPAIAWTNKEILPSPAAPEDFGRVRSRPAKTMMRFALLGLTFFSLRLSAAPNAAPIPQGRWTLSSTLRSAVRGRLFDQHMDMVFPDAYRYRLKPMEPSSGEELVVKALAHSDLSGLTDADRDKFEALVGAPALADAGLIRAQLGKDLRLRDSKAAEILDAERKYGLDPNVPFEDLIKKLDARFDGSAVAAGILVPEEPTQTSEKKPWDDGRKQQFLDKLELLTKARRGGAASPSKQLTEDMSSLGLYLFGNIDNMPREQQIEALHEIARQIGRAHV